MIYTERQSGEVEIGKILFPYSNFSKFKFGKLTTFFFFHSSDDIVVDVHAGLKDNANGLIDNNCNGIYGNNAQGESYEQLYCESSPASSSRRSLVMFGDSASAAFRIPVEVYLPFFKDNFYPQPINCILNLN